MENFWTYFEVLAPSVGVGLIFWFALRSILRADRRERAVEAQIRAEEGEGQADEHKPTETRQPSDGPASPTSSAHSPEA